MNKIILKIVEQYYDPYENIRDINLKTNMQQIEILYFFIENLNIDKKIIFRNINIEIIF